MEIYTDTSTDHSLIMKGLRIVGEITDTGSIHRANQYAHYVTMTKTPIGNVNSSQGGLEALTEGGYLRGVKG